MEPGSSNRSGSMMYDKSSRSSPESKDVGSNPRLDEEMRERDYVTWFNIFNWFK